MTLAKLAATCALLACSAAPKRDPGEQHADRPREALVGRPAPAAALELLDGERVALSDLAGKPVYLEFWATWCVPCRRQMPHLEATHRKYGDQLAVFAVDLGLNDPVDTVRAFRAEHAMTVPIALDTDGNLAERFHVAVTPQHILLDRAGVVRYLGHTPSAELDATLDALVHEPAPAAPRPTGAPPSAAPLSLTLRDGSTFTLAAHAGQPIALTFVSASCDWYLATSRPAMAEACTAHARQVESVHAAHASMPWVMIVHPVWTSTAELDSYRQRFAITTPIGIDDSSSWFHRFAVRDVPTTILLDASGAELARIGGRGDDLPRALASAP